MTIKILTFNVPTGLLEGVRAEYEGPVPLKVWLRLYRRVMKLDRDGYFRPLSTLDVYNSLVAKVQTIAENPPELKDATLETYLMGAINLELMSIGLRKVRPARREQLQVGRLLSKAAAEFTEAGDFDTADSLTARDLVELLPGCPSFEERLSAARSGFEEVLSALVRCRAAHIAKAFRAYVTAKCDLRLAAELLKLGKSSLYARWKNYLKRARLICEESGK